MLLSKIDRYLEDYLFYSTTCKMTPKGGQQNTERPIKCEPSQVAQTNLLSDQYLYSDQNSRLISRTKNGSL